MEFASTYGMGMHTTCVYQFVPSRKGVGAGVSICPHSSTISPSLKSSMYPNSCSSELDMTKFHEKSGKKISIIQCFTFPTLGICRRMKNYVAHMWTASAVAHATTMPLFILDGMVHFGNHPFAEVVAWGAGNASRCQPVRDQDRRRAAAAAAQAETRRMTQERFQRWMARSELSRRIHGGEGTSV